MTALSATDREALERALRIGRALSFEERDYLDYVLREDGWQRAAEAAVYRQQDAALRLRPWQSPPCCIDPDEVDDILAAGDDGVQGQFAAARLVQRLLRAGLSQFEPDPLAALEAAKRTTAKVKKETAPTSVAGAV
jgi:hypothetical protein